MPFPDELSPDGVQVLPYQHEWAERALNIHVRLAGAETTRLALLFRDYLRTHPDKVQLWSEFKVKVAAIAPDLSAYGQIKAPAWLLLMELAEIWERSGREK